MGVLKLLDAMVTSYCGQHFFTVLSLLTIIDRIISLELLELRVPTHVALGARAHLSCRWALSPTDVLYSVKWYKDGREFYRHVPRDSEPQRKFPLPGVVVEVSDSSGSRLELSGVVSETAGRYRCEVSGERPLFPTVSAHADMNVVVLPEQGPIITGFKARYRLGEHIQCLATLASLYWRSNEESASLQKVKIHERMLYNFQESNSRADRVLYNVASLLTSSTINILCGLLHILRVRQS